MKTCRYGPGICPRCGVRKRANGHSYCMECKREISREARLADKQRSSPAFLALMEESRKISMSHLKDMGYIKRRTD